MIIIGVKRPLSGSLCLSTVCTFGGAGGLESGGSISILWGAVMDYDPTLGMGDTEGTMAICTYDVNSMLWLFT